MQSHSSRQCVKDNPSCMAVGDEAHVGAFQEQQQVLLAAHMWLASGGDRALASFCVIEPRLQILDDKCWERLMLLCWLSCLSSCFQFVCVLGQQSSPGPPAGLLAELLAVCDAKGQLFHKLLTSGVPADF